MKYTREAGAVELCQKCRGDGMSFRTGNDCKACKGTGFVRARPKLCDDAPSDASQDDFLKKALAGQEMHGN